MERSLHEKEKKPSPCHPDLIILLYPPSGELWPAHARSEVPRFDVQHPATSKRAHPEIHWRISRLVLFETLETWKTMNKTWISYTSLKFNMVHLKINPWKRKSFWKSAFSGSMLNFWGVSHKNWNALWRRASKSSLCVSVLEFWFKY